MLSEQRSRVHSGTRGPHVTTITCLVRSCTPRSSCTLIGRERRDVTDHVTRRVTQRYSFTELLLYAYILDLYSLCLFSPAVFEASLSADLVNFADLMMADSSTSPTYTLGGAESTTSDDFIRSSAISSSQSPQKSGPAEDISHVKRPMNAFMVRFDIFPPLSGTYCFFYFCVIASTDPEIAPDLRR